MRHITLSIAWLLAFVECDRSCKDWLDQMGEELNAKLPGKLFGSTETSLAADQDISFGFLALKKKLDSSQEAGCPEEFALRWVIGVVKQVRAESVLSVKNKDAILAFMKRIKPDFDAESMNECQALESGIVALVNEIQDFQVSKGIMKSLKTLEEVRTEFLDNLKRYPKDECANELRDRLKELDLLLYSAKVFGSKPEFLETLRHCTNKMGNFLNSQSRLKFKSGHVKKLFALMPAQPK